MKSFDDGSLVEVVALIFLLLIQDKKSPQEEEEDAWEKNDELLNILLHYLLFLCASILCW